MPKPGIRPIFAWCSAWLFAAALYLLLIDTVDLTELIVGAVAAALAATGLELAREEHIVVQALRPRWLLRLYRPLAKVPSDLATLLVVAVQQVFHPRRRRGAFRTVRFEHFQKEPVETGRRALAEGLGSFSPNTIVIGVDGERGLMLAHQLRPRGEPESLDVLGLG